MVGIYKDPPRLWRQTALAGIFKCPPGAPAPSSFGNFYKDLPEAPAPKRPEVFFEDSPEALAPNVLRVCSGTPRGPSARAQVTSASHDTFRVSSMRRGRPSFLNIRGGGGFRFRWPWWPLDDKVGVSHICFDPCIDERQSRWNSTSICVWGPCFLQGQRSKPGGAGPGVACARVLWPKAVKKAGPPL